MEAQAFVFENAVGRSARRGCPDALLSNSLNLIANRTRLILTRQAATEARTQQARKTVYFPRLRWRSAEDDADQSIARILSKL
jgi:hypothetical protein